MNAKDYAQQERLIVSVENNNNCFLSGGSQKIVLSNGVGQASFQKCKFCRIQVRKKKKGQAVRVRLNTICDENSGIELPKNPIMTSYLINNLNLLYFYSEDANAVVDIEYFN